MAYGDEEYERIVRQHQEGAIARLRSDLDAARRDLTNAGRAGISARDEMQAKWFAAEGEVARLTSENNDLAAGAYRTDAVLREAEGEHAALRIRNETLTLERADLATALRAQNDLALERLERALAAERALEEAERGRDEAREGLTAEHQDFLAERRQHAIDIGAGERRLLAAEAVLHDLGLGEGIGEGSALAAIRAKMDLLWPSPAPSAPSTPAAPAAPKMCRYGQPHLEGEGVLCAEPAAPSLPEEPRTCAAGTTGCRGGRSGYLDPGITGCLVCGRRAPSPDAESPEEKS